MGKKDPHLFAIKNTAGVIIKTPILTATKKKNHRSYMTLIALCLLINKVPLLIQNLTL